MRKKIDLKTSAIQFELNEISLLLGDGRRFFFDGNDSAYFELFSHLGLPNLTKYSLYSQKLIHSKKMKLQQAIESVMMVNYKLPTRPGIPDEVPVNFIFKAQNKVKTVTFWPEELTQQYSELFILNKIILELIQILQNTKPVQTKQIEISEMQSIVKKRPQVPDLH